MLINQVKINYLSSTDYRAAGAGALWAGVAGAAVRGIIKHLPKHPQRPVQGMFRTVHAHWPVNLFPQPHTLKGVSFFDRTSIDVH